MSYLAPMRASRLLQILLLLQNRGRMTSAVLARELEVAQRTILRDVDALTEAGISNRSCLLARLPDPPAAAPGECARAARSLLSCSPSRGAGGARGTCERFRWGLQALTLFRQRFHSILRRRRWRWRRCWRHCGSRKVSR